MGAAEAIYPSKGAAFSASASASASAASASASKTSISASSTSIAQSKTTTTTEKTSSVKFDSAMEQQRSIEYGKQSKSRALRRAELHALHSGGCPSRLPIRVEGAEHSQGCFHARKMQGGEDGEGAEQADGERDVLQVKLCQVRQADGHGGHDGL